MNKQAKRKTVLGEYNSKPEGIQGKGKQKNFKRCSLPPTTISHTHFVLNKSNKDNHSSRQGLKTINKGRCRKV